MATKKLALSVGLVAKIVVIGIWAVTTFNYVRLQETAFSWQSLRPICARANLGCQSVEELAAHSMAVTRSDFVGGASGTLAITIPILIWLLVFRTWVPQSRLQYAFRFSLWPAVVLSSQMAGPIARFLFGIDQSLLRGGVDTFVGVIVLSTTLGVICFVIGWMLGKKQAS
jgi:hypothetical protein